MTKASFYKLVDNLKPLTEKKDTIFRKALPPDERVAIALYRLTTNMFYRNVAQQFGRGHATCVDVTNEVVDAICQSKAQFIRWPNDEELRQIMTGFLKLSGLPMVAGAVDGRHIPVVAPADQRNDYYCYKGFYSVNTQAVVDHRGRFYEYFHWISGLAHDARLLYSSAVYQKAVAGTLFGELHGNIIDLPISLYLIGDGAYPMEPWLMKAYDSGALSDAEIKFKVCLNRKEPHRTGIWPPESEVSVTSKADRNGRLARAQFDFGMLLSSQFFARSKTKLY